jgi:hypothetical protein
MSTRLPLIAVAIALAACATSPPPVGVLAITVSGLPPGVAADVTVFGPDAFREQLAATGELSGLAPGTYELVVASVEAEGDAFVPDRFRDEIVLHAGARASVAVAYAPRPASRGSLAVVIEGLPDGAEANVRVTGPAGVEEHLTESAALDGLPTGSYIVDADDVDLGARRFAPDATSQSVAVEAGTVAEVRVVYADPSATLARLFVAVAGLPDGAAAAIEVTGPDGFAAALDGPSQLDDLAPGTYALAATPVRVGPPFHTYAPDVGSQTLELAAGETRGVGIAYAATTGALEFLVNGLPGDVAAGIDLSGPDGFSATIDASVVLDDLAPGPYGFEPVTLHHARTVTRGEVGFTYAPARILLWDGRVVAGETASTAVEYEPVSGSLQVMIEGLPRGAAPHVRVAGLRLSDSATVNNLDPGTYSVEIREVDAGGYTFAGAAATIDVVIEAGRVTATTVRYRPVDGQLAVEITGLPPGVAGDVRIVGPSTHALTESRLLRGLEPGTYLVTARTVATGQFGRPSCRLHVPEPASLTTTVHAFERTTLSIAYSVEPCPSVPTPPFGSGPLAPDGDHHAHEGRTP